MPTRPTLTTLFLAIALLVSTLTLIAHLRWDHHAELFHPPPLSPKSEHSSPSTHNGDGTMVPLEIHIMSKCPDAKDCLEMLIAPAMANISTITNFRMSFIGRPTEVGVSCLHGPSECLSNTLHLCAAHLYPTSTALPFSVCLTHNYTLLPQQAFIEACAEAHDVSFAKLNECISDIGPEGGMHMLTKSVQRSRRLGAEVSCTVRVDKKKWCVRDGREWKGCDNGTKPEDLVEYVKALHHEKNKERGLVRQNVKERVREWIRGERIVWRI